MEFEAQCGDQTYMVRCCELPPDHTGQHVDSDGAKFDGPHPNDKSLAVAHYRDLSGAETSWDPAHNAFAVKGK